MNFLRSKIAAYSGTTQNQPKKPQQSIVPKRTNQQVFESIKKWDKQRAQILRKHIHVVEQILRSLQIRVKNSHEYILGIESILKGRLRQLQSYKSNSLNNSSFVLLNNHQPEYKESYDLLKELVIFEAQKDDKIVIKYNKIKDIYLQFVDFHNRETQKSINQLHLDSPKKDKTNEKKTSQQEQGEGNADLDQTSVVILKSNVRYLIDCELSDIIEETAKWCQQINKSYHQSQQLVKSSGQLQPDFYILVTKFLHGSKMQVQKHREIGKELLSLIKEFVQREKKRCTKIKYTLSQWVKQDQNANPLLINQLQKQGRQSLIDDYYSLDELVESQLPQMKNSTIQDYLTHISIRPFQRAQQLVVFRCDCFYNKKIQTEVIITIDRHCHLRKHNRIDPDFSFLLDKEIFISQQEEFVFKFEKIQKKFLKAPEKQFQFVLEFNIVEDILKLIDVLQDVEWSNLKCR